MKRIGRTENLKEIQAKRITEEVKKMAISANVNIHPDILDALRKAVDKEKSPTGKEILEQIIENDEIAMREGVPICQDTGFAIIFLDIGQDIHVVGGNLYDAIDEGVRQGYKEGFLRKSIVSDPLERKNTQDNTPAIIHTRILPGEELKITFDAKGGGSENMSTVRMMPPSAGVEGIKKFVVEWVREAGSNPCPPIFVGIGIGGNFETCALLAKKALLRKIGERNHNPFYANLEKEILMLINKTGIGPQGLGGTTTALEVFIEYHPCHIASFPVAINIDCHAHRALTVVL